MTLTLSITCLVLALLCAALSQRIYSLELDREHPRRVIAYAPPTASGVWLWMNGQWMEVEDASIE